MQSAESCRKLTASADPPLFTKKKVLTCSISRSSCWIISSSKAWKRFCERREKQDLFESTRWASLNCDGFKCVSARAAHVTISTLTERPLGMPVRDSWPFPCDCDNNDWRWGFDGPKTPGNESSKWQRKKGRVCSCFAHCKVSTKERSAEQWIFMPFFSA